MPELIITNAHALTQDPAAPSAEAVVISGDRLSFVGSEADALQRRRAETQVINVESKTLLPGIIDSHFHLLWGSLRLGDIQLEGVTGLDGLRQTILAYRERHPNQALLRGQGLSYEVVPGARLTRQHLDDIVPPEDANIIFAQTCSA